MIDAIWVLNSTILTWFALSLLGEPVLERVVIRFKSYPCASFIDVHKRHIGKLERSVPLTFKV